MYAVFRDRSRQHAVRQGDVVRCDLAAALEAGQEITFDEVLLVASEGAIQVGKPLVEGARVRAEVVGHGKGPKLIAFRFKRRKNVRVKRGHRQKHTTIRIVEIQA